MMRASTLVRVAIGDLAYAAIMRDLGGYNLMPHRSCRARAARRSRALGTACAALGGIGAAAALAALQASDERQLTAQRHALEARLIAHAPQIAEHTKLSAVLSRHERDAARARQRAASRHEFLALLDRLAAASSAGVVLTELHRRDGATVLSGRVGDQRRLSNWLDELRGVRGVTSAQVLSLRRPQLSRGGISSEVLASGRAGDTGDRAGTDDLHDKGGNSGTVDVRKADVPSTARVDATKGGLEFVARLIHAQPGNEAGDHPGELLALRGAAPSKAAKEDS